MYQLNRVRRRIGWQSEEINTQLYKGQTVFCRSVSMKLSLLKISGFNLILILILNLVLAYEGKAAGLDQAIAILGKTETGKKVLEEARAQHLSIVEGKISKTDIVATRVIQGKEEKLDFTVQVIISHEKNPIFQAIDLAHELVHALHPKTNPFDPKLNAVDYVREGIESEGGEAHAILQECQVGKELIEIVNQEQAQLIKARCQFVWKTGKDSNLWKLSFYYLGNQYGLFAAKLKSMNSDQGKKDEISRIIQTKDPMFTSAAANKPYPLALLDEYLEITQKICSKSTARSVASISNKAVRAENTTMDERCQSLSSALFSP